MPDPPIRGGGPTADGRRNRAQDRTRYPLDAAEEAVKRNTALRGELAEMVHFEFAKATIQPNDLVALNRKVAILDANPTVRLLITGACDHRVSDQYNQALGRRRATAVKEYFVTM